MKISTLSATVAAVSLSTGVSAGLVPINNGDNFGTTSFDFQLLGTNPTIEGAGYVGRGDPRAAADLGFGTFELEDGPEFFTRGATLFDLPSNYSLVDSVRFEVEFPEDGEQEEIGFYTDQVWLNSTTGTLAFATRVTLLPEFDDDEGVFEYEGEFNEVRRDYGGFTTEAAYFAATGIDRVFDAVSKSGDTVTFVNDMSGEEGSPDAPNAYSVWHVVQTNATTYTTATGAVILFSEEDPSEGRFEDFLWGTENATFIPTPVPAALPLLASAVGGLGFAACRRR